jgi:hypothetical protein
MTPQVMVWCGLAYQPCAASLPGNGTFGNCRGNRRALKARLGALQREL